MGNGSDFFARNEKGRRSEYTKLAPSITINGVKGTLIKKVGDKDTHTNHPYYSNTSEIYFRRNAKGICQARVYVGQKLFLDFDWSHNHTNIGTGRVFKSGTVHVQVWRQNADGTFSRLGNDARSMNNAEIKRYGDVLKAFCPHIKLK